MLFEGETGIPREAFGVGTERLQEALHLDADVVVSGQLVFSRSGRSSLNFYGLNYSRLNPTHPGLHFSPPEAERTTPRHVHRNPRYLAMLPFVETHGAGISFAEGEYSNYRVIREKVNGTIGLRCFR
jgi:hypothetical protein